MILKVLGITVTRRDWKRTYCSHCDEEYYYLNEQKGYGEQLGVPLVGADQMEASATYGADEAVNYALWRRDSLARCPRCSKFQRKMIEDAAQDRQARARRIGITLSVLAMFGFALAAAIFPKDNNWLLLSIFVSFGVGILLTFLWMQGIRRYFDPNKGTHLLMPPDKEIASSGITVEDFERLVESERTQIQNSSSLPRPTAGESQE
ncbi:MAG: hypothetical protein K8I27_06960 [Planctomycetes bacterium]|nr:hypothetical protein [Planctomycetota bacterium]